MTDSERTDTRPNIIVILVDDMGFSDIGCFGSEIQTPNIDALAQDGVRFTQMYNCARCCPTRASILTGLYPHQAGVGHMVSNYGMPAYQGYLRDDCVTIAEVLKGAGYRTLLSGKWHVGGGYQANRPETWSPGTPEHPTPVQRGFDEHYGMLGGGGSYFNPPYMIDNSTIVHPGGEEYYLTDDITDHAVSMIERNAAVDNPFFLYVGYTAPHWPLHALPEDIAKYEGSYRSLGWDGVRTRRHEELKGLGILDPRWPISARDEQAPPWSDVREKDWEDRRMAVYAAQVDRMDQGVGRIMQALRDHGVEEDTIVMFLSDNGGCAEFLAEDTNRKEPFRYNIPTPDGRPMRVGNTPAIDPGPDDTFMSYDLPWANASNSPFRLFKHWVHEGGIATPLLVRWPKRAQPGAVVHRPSHVVDIMATCVEAAGASYPTERNGTSIQPMEGESLLPVLNGDGGAERQTLFWEHEGNRAVRKDNWKIVSKYPGKWELYDMQRDRTETDDLSAKYPDTVKTLEREYLEWAARVGVVEWGELLRRRSG
jgi:arylsulfatase A-like enzyme